MSIFGLDFGTTNSALAVNRNGIVEIIDIDQYNPTAKTLRSVIYFNEDDDVYVGYEAIKNYIDNDATGRFMQSIKSFLPSALFESTEINGKTYELEDLIAIILKEIKERGEIYLGREVMDVIMGRPAIFSKNEAEDRLAESRLKKAAEIVGFKNIAFQYEPIAAALAFEKSLKKGEEKIVFIGDFGGGTSDFSIIKLRGGKSGKLDRKDDILSLGGINIAGDAFDSKIMWEKAAKYFGKDVKYKTMKGEWMAIPPFITFKLRHWHLISQLRSRKIIESIGQIKVTADNRQAIENLENLIEDNYGFMLFQAIEKAKIDLSFYNASRIVFKERRLEIMEEIARKEFEKFICEDVAKISKCVGFTLSSANLKPKNIDVVFTTGGTSHIPCIRKIFKRKFGEGKMIQMDTFTSVAYGLGICAPSFF